ncbi:HAUS augmin-like complex subunit 2 [Indicator indicator]|uniref:HAUS augmin-like complex subunit 2 n=1 Tax=Indicator indicator TaxID=1002788 RepID=UPI0023E018B8|nr:HAUS augmin-like complex subunit 2 [Indicator indicator]
MEIGHDFSGIYQHRLAVAITALCCSSGSSSAQLSPPYPSRLRSGRPLRTLPRARLRPSRTTARGSSHRLPRKRTRVTSFTVTPKMAAAQEPRMRPLQRPSRIAGTAGYRRPESPAKADDKSRPSRQQDLEGSGLWCGAAATTQPWKLGQPTAAGALLARCLEAGVVSRETLDLTCRKTPCFVKFSEVEKMANMQAEINEKRLKAEILQLEKDTADIAHPFYLRKKCEVLQDVNRHLEAVLKNKKALKKRLIKPRCQNSLPIEATFHKYVVELLSEAVTFIEKLESHLQAVRTIPQIPDMMKNMDTALTKTEMLVMELEDLADQILKWKDVQKQAYSDSICNTAELDFGLSFA